MALHQSSTLTRDGIAVQVYGNGTVDEACVVELRLGVDEVAAKNDEPLALLLLSRIVQYTAAVIGCKLSGSAEAVSVSVEYNEGIKLYVCVLFGNDTVLGGKITRYEIVGGDIINGGNSGKGCNALCADVRHIIVDERAGMHGENGILTVGTLAELNSLEAVVNLHSSHGGESDGSSVYRVGDLQRTATLLEQSPVFLADALVGNIDIAIVHSNVYVN